MVPTGQSPTTSWRTFRFLRQIGKGGFGEVYLVEMSTGGGFAKPVAIKVLREDYLEDEEVLKRLRDEARLLGQLSHPNIVQAEDLITLAGRLAVVMEYVPGANLNWVINPRVYPEAIPPTVCCQIISSVAEALDAAWGRPSTLTGEPLRVLHRDIKPSNIRLTPDGVIKVLDFGVARAEFNEREADTQDLRMGSIPYMAPETLLDLPHSAASDIYALGVTFYELVARKRFGKCKLQRGLHDALINERMIQANLSDFLLAAEELEDLLRQMLHFDPHQRPSVAEVVSRCRDIERRTVGPRLNEWAPTIVPGVVQSVTIEQSSGGLIGQTLSEDSSTTSGTSRTGAGVLAESPDPTDEERPTEVTEADGAVSALDSVSSLDSLAPPPPPPPPPVPQDYERRPSGRLAKVAAILVLLGSVIAGGVFWMNQPDESAVGVLPPPQTTVTVDPPESADEQPVPVQPPRLVEPVPETPAATSPPRGSQPEQTRSSKPPAKSEPKPSVETKPAVTEPEPEREPEPKREPAPDRAAEPAPDPSVSVAPEPEPEPQSAPVAPVASAATQEIAFSSKPLGVAVSVDGVYRGTTPLRVTLKEGPHKIAYEGPDGTRYKNLVVVAGERQVVIYDSAKDVIR
jgi:serine/threonine protein kinase